MNLLGLQLQMAVSHYVSVGSPPTRPSEEQPVLLTAGISLLPQELGYLPSKYSRHPGLKAALLPQTQLQASQWGGAPCIASECVCWRQMCPKKVPLLLTCHTSTGEAETGESEF